jgi:hypothetical protein
MHRGSTPDSAKDKRNAWKHGGRSAEFRHFREGMKFRDGAIAVL